MPYTCEHHKTCNECASPALSDQLRKLEDEQRARAEKAEATIVEMKQQAHTAVQHLATIMHLYSGFQVEKRGPVGLLINAIEKLEPEAARKIKSGEAGEDWELLIDKEDEACSECGGQGFYSLSDEPDKEITCEACQGFDRNEALIEHNEASAGCSACKDEGVRKLCSVCGRDTRPKEVKVTTPEQDQVTLREIADLVSNVGLDHEGVPSAIVAAVGYLIDENMRHADQRVDKAPPAEPHETWWLAFDSDEDVMPFAFQERKRAEEEIDSMHPQRGAKITGPFILAGSCTDKPLHETIDRLRRALGLPEGKVTSDGIVNEAIRRLVLTRPPPDQDWGKENKVKDQKKEDLEDLVKAATAIAVMDTRVDVRDYKAVTDLQRDLRLALDKVDSNWCLSKEGS